MRRLLKGGRVIDPANGRDGIFDILIDGDRIARVGKDLPVDGATRLRLVAPGIRNPALRQQRRQARLPAVRRHLRTAQEMVARGQRAHCVLILDR